jgi:probable HAF family extracellular repeat protein
MADATRTIAAWRTPNPALRALIGRATLCLAAAACTDITGAEEEPDELARASIFSDRAYSLAGLSGLPATSFPRSLNNEGTIVGWLRPASGDMQAFVWRRGSVTELPGLGGPTSSAEDINQREVIVGHAENEDGHPRAVMWRRGRIMDLGTLGGDVSFATAINDRGQVVGTAETAGGDLHAFLWSRGEMTDLGGLPGFEFSWAEDLNNRGTIVGWSAGGPFSQRANKWQDGEIVDLGTLNHESAAAAINARGQIVGASILELEALAVIWERGRMRMLGTLGGTFSSAHAINAAGQVVGASQPEDGEQTAFIWQRNMMIDLGRGPGELSNAFDINARGTVVGFAGGPVVWTKGSQSPAATSSHEALGRWRASPQLLSADPPRWAEMVCRARGELATPSSGIAVAAGC